MRDLLMEFPDFAKACRKMHRSRLEQCKAILEELGKADEAGGRITPTAGHFVGNFSDPGDKIVAASTIQRFYRGRGDTSFIEVVRDAARKHKAAKAAMERARSPPREPKSHRPLARPEARSPPCEPKSDRPIVRPAAHRPPPPSFLPAHLTPGRPRSASDDSFGEEHHEEKNREPSHSYDLEYF